MCLESLANSLLTGVQELDYIVLGFVAVHVVICCRDRFARARETCLCLKFAIRELVLSSVIKSG